MSQERPDEQFAFAVVRRVLDADVRLHDTGGRQGAVDGIVTYPDGRVAALEISSVGPEDEARITNVLSRSQSRRQLAGISHHWYVQVPGDFHPAELRSIDQAVLRCEELGFDHLSDAVGHGHTDLDALALRHVSADAIHTTSAPEQATRRVYVYRRPPGGFLRDGIEPLPDELAEMLRTTTMQSKIAKLVRSGLDERHLLLLVRQSAFSFPVYDGLAWGGPLPSRPARLPAELSQVWLLTGYAAGGVVRATASGAWFRDHPYDKAS